MPDAVHEQWNLSVFQVARSPYQSLQARIEHPHWAVSLIVEGEVQTTAGGMTFHAPAGSVMVHPPHLPYTERNAGPGMHEWVVFEAAVSPGLDLFRLHPIAPVVPLAEIGAFREAFDHLLRAWQEPPGTLRGLRVSALAAELLGRLLESWRTEGSPPRPSALCAPPDRFTGVISYMADHLSRKMTREELAGQLCLHPSHFDRAFREAHGVAPMQMLRDLRLRRARQMLENTDATLETIALACGFEGAAYFSRVFARRHGQPPGAYRQGVRAAVNSFPAEPMFSAEA